MPHGSHAHRGPGRPGPRRRRPCIHTGSPPPAAGAWLLSPSPALLHLLLPLRQSSMASAGATRKFHGVSRSDSEVPWRQPERLGVAPGVDGMRLPRDRVGGGRDLSVQSASVARPLSVARRRCRRRRRAASQAGRIGGGRREPAACGEQTGANRCRPRSHRNGPSMPRWCAAPGWQATCGRQDESISNSRTCRGASDFRSKTGSGPRKPVVGEEEVHIEALNQLHKFVGFLHSILLQHDSAKFRVFFNMIPQRS